MKPICFILALLFMFSGVALSEDFVSFVDSYPSERIVLRVAVDDEADEIIVRFNTDADNVRILVCPAFSGESLYSLAHVSAGDAVSVRIYIPDTMPNLCLSYTPKGGERQSVWISESGMDGSLLFIEGDRLYLTDWVNNVARGLAAEVLASLNDAEYMRSTVGDYTLDEIKKSVGSVSPVSEYAEAEILFIDDLLSMPEAAILGEAVPERAQTRIPSLIQMALMSKGGVNFLTAANITVSESYLSEPAGFADCLATFTGEGDSCVSVAFERVAEGIVKATAMLAPQPS